MSKIEQMFDYQGKTTKVIGIARTQDYLESYKLLTEQQKNKQIPYHGNYLGENKLARNIYEKKYFLKDLKNKLIEKNPEDVFKRLAAFLAAVETSKAKQKKWAERF